MIGMRGERGAANLSVRANVIGALIIRDLMARFGRDSLGFVWTVLEPMILTTGVMIVWALIRPAVYHGVPIVAFVLTGYMPLTLWRHLNNPLIRIMRGNAPLLYHRVILHSDVLVARQVLEFLSTSLALAVVYFTVYSLGLVEPVADPGLLLAGWLYTAWLFTGVGMLLSALSEAWEVAEKFVQPTQYLALPISGVFFLVDWMPGYAQHLLLLNPTVNCFEMFRAGFFGGSIQTHYDVFYLTAWCCALSVCGAAAVYGVRDKVALN